MRVVIIDDSPADRRLCRTLLEEAYGSEWEFLEEGTGSEGLKTCRSVIPDCVLIDYKLPDMTGLELLGRLRAGNSSDRDLAVVMITGLGCGEVAAASLRAGAQDYLVKDHMSAEGLSLAITKAIEKMELIRSLKAERDRLARSLAEKEILLKEVHHRVKNNLQVIASLLRFEAASGEEGALRGIQHRVESMAFIHEQLYETGDLREVDLAKHAALLATNLFDAYGVDPARIACRVTMEPLSLGVDQAIPAGLILNELISNALKHGFRNGRAGSLSIEGGRRGGRIALEVRDDGVGIPEGIGLEKPKSLGLEIVNILTRQLKGTFELDRGRDTTFRVSFPEQHEHNQVFESAGSGR